MRVLPSDRQFFALLAELTAQLTAASRLLVELCKTEAKAAPIIRAIKTVDHLADDVTRRINERLDRSFAPPFDREDLHALAAKLDSIVDLIDGTARRFSSFHVEAPTAAAASLAQLVWRSAQELEKAVATLPVRGGAKASEKHLSAVKGLEEQGDAIYAEAIGELFAAPPDVLYVIKWKGLYDRLEETLDESQHTALVIQGIALKHT